MASFIERIIKIQKLYNFKSLNEFAIKGLGYEKSEKINRLKKIGNNPSYEIVVDVITKFDNVNPSWLLIERGEMLLESNKKLLNNVKGDKEEALYVPPEDELLNDRAVMAVLLNEFLKIQSLVTGRKIEECKTDFRLNTNLKLDEWRELRQKNEQQFLVDKKGAA